MASIPQRQGSEWLRPLATVVVLMLAIATSGCGGSDGEKGSESLWNRDFVSTSAAAGGQPKQLVSETEINLNFTGPKAGSMGWRGGCNRFGASVRISADQLLVRETFGTLMGCESRLEGQDEWLSDFFESNPQWTLDGGRLTLTSGSSSIEMREVRG